MTIRANVDQKSKMTVESVLKEIQTLRARGDAEVARNVWAKPYRPTDLYVRKLCKQMGPEGALQYIRRRAAEKDADAREEAQVSEYAQKRLARHHAREAEARRERDLGISPGRRIDRAIAKLGTMSEVSAAQVDPNPVHGTREKGQAPKRGGDAQQVARRIARAAAEEIEGMVNETNRRDLGRAA